MPVFAGSFDPTDGTSTGTGAILAYNVEKVVVPTTMKVAINPNGYTVNIRYNKVDQTAVTAPATGTTYYTLVDDKYVKQPSTLTAWAADTDYYTADTSASRIISLNYGIANKSTRDKVVKVDIAVKQDTSTTDGKEPIVIVGTEEEAQAYNATSNTDGAKLNEMKMYLGLIASKEAPKVDTFNRAKTFTDNATVYYKLKADKSDYELVGTDGKLADADAFATALDAAPNKKLFTKADNSAIGTEIRAVELSDVSFTNAEAGEAAFTAGKENKANAAIGYLLGKATYGIADDQYLDFDDTQATVADKIELTALTGVAGFTIRGEMNTNTDWTRADASALKFVPTYTISDATGDEVAVDSANAFNQIKLGPQISLTKTGLVTITGATCISSELKEASATAGTQTFSLLGDNTVTIEDPADGTITIQMGESWLTAWSDQDVSVTVTLKDDTVLTSGSVKFD
jgi:hypothetical protein